MDGVSAISGAARTGLGAQGDVSLEEAARKFETLVMQQLFRSAHESSSRWSSLLDNGEGSRLYRGLFIDEVVGQAVALRSLGLTERLVAQHGDPEETRNE